jgi:hypothetical protein
MSTTTTNINLTAAQEASAEQMADDWGLFADYVDPGAAMAGNESEFFALPYAERLQAARQSIAYNQ